MAVDYIFDREPVTDGLSSASHNASEVWGHPSTFLQALSLLETMGKVFTLSPQQFVTLGLDTMWLKVYGSLWNGLAGMQGDTSGSANSVGFVFLLRSVPMFAKMLSARSLHLPTHGSHVQPDQITSDLNAIDVFFMRLSYCLAFHCSPALALDILTSQPVWSIFESGVKYYCLSGNIVDATYGLIWVNIIVDTILSAYTKLPSVCISKWLHSGGRICDNDLMAAINLFSFPHLVKAHAHNHEKFDCFTSSLKDAMLAFSDGQSSVVQGKFILNSYVLGSSLCIIMCVCSIMKTFTVVK